MLIIPAIDLQDGCVVRYVQGKLSKKVYSRDPIKTAKHWAKAGAKLLHVVDLDGAFTGTPKNIGVVKELAKASGAPIEFGGGVRSMDLIKELIDAGIQRVILGTKAAEDKAFLDEAYSRFGERVIVGVDAGAGKVMVKGWKESSDGLDCLTFAGALKSMGFKEIIYTDTLKDGTLTGPNIKGIKELLKATGLRIIASGGISSLDDISRLKKLEDDGVTGVIIGKALYEGKFTLGEALKFS